MSPASKHAFRKTTLQMQQHPYSSTLQISLWVIKEGLRYKSCKSHPPKWQYRFYSRDHKLSNHVTPPYWWINKPSHVSLVKMVFCIGCGSQNTRDKHLHFAQVPSVVNKPRRRSRKIVIVDWLPTLNLGHKKNVENRNMEQVSQRGQRANDKEKK